MPAEVILPKAQHLAKVLACGWKNLAINIERDPVDDPPIAHGASLGLPTLPRCEPKNREVVCNLGGPGDPATKTTANRVRTRIVLVVGAKDEWRTQRR